MPANTQVRAYRLNHLITNDSRDILSIDAHKRFKGSVFMACNWFVNSING